jgi:uncharacterized protein (DUF2236 family)
MSSLFADDAVIRRIGREGALVVGGGRALLMQLAHPAVAQAVAEHSDFQADPLARLRATLEAVFTLVFGTDDEAAQVAAAVRSVHDRVMGPGYQADDPALLCWVNATLTDTAMRVYSDLVRPLHDADAERYYEESTRIAEILGCPRDRQPADLDEFRAYMHEMVNTLEVTDTARRMGDSVLHPHLPLYAEPPLVLFRFVTVGMLPRPLREQYGLRWDGRRKLVLRAGATATRTMLMMVPSPIRHAPLTYFNWAA